MPPLGAFWEGTESRCQLQPLGEELGEDESTLWPIFVSFSKCFKDCRSQPGSQFFKFLFYHTTFISTWIQQFTFCHTWFISLSLCLLIHSRTYFLLLNRWKAHSVHGDTSPLNFVSLICSEYRYPSM